MLDITTIILTFNEEKHIKRCIDSVKRVSKVIYIVDSFSTDQTCEIAKECGAIVLQNNYVNQAQQFQWALNNCKIKTEWTLRLDADEYLTPELESEMIEKIPFLNKKITGVYFRLGVIFMERLLKYGYIKPVTILRLWRTGKVYMEQRWMDERCVLKEGESVTFKHKFIDHNLNGLTFFIQKHNAYSNREVLVYYSKDLGLYESDEKNIDRDKTKGKYYSCPLFLRSFLYFFIRYFIFGGFLDGKAGLIWATLQAYWYRFLIDSKLYEIKVRLGKRPSPEDLREYFHNNYGIKI